MSTIERIFDGMSDRYLPGKVSRERTYYFSIGELKYTVRISREECTVEKGKTIEQADCVLKTTPELFEKMVIKGKMPGPVDIMRGRVKTNDPLALKNLRELFDFSGL